MLSIISPCGTLVGTNYINRFIGDIIPNATLLLAYTMLQSIVSLFRTVVGISAADKELCNTAGKRSKQTYRLS